MLRGATLDDERPPSLLTRRPPSFVALLMGLIATLAGHLLIPVLLFASQWLLVALGMAVPLLERERPKLPDNVIAAEFVRLGTPKDPKKLPSRKVPPIAKRESDAVAVSKDPKEKVEKPEKEKKKPEKDTQQDLLSNLVDRTRDFAEDVKHEQEGDPEGLAEGTATEARAGNIYLGKLVLFFRRGWEVPNVLGDVGKLKTLIGVEIGRDGRVLSGTLMRSSGEPLFDQSALDRVADLVAAGATIPEPPPDMRASLYGVTSPVLFDGAGMR